MTRLAISAEWTKFWSVRATWWCLIGGAALMTMYAVIAALSDPRPPHAIVAGGAVYLVEFCVISVATLFVTSEYTSGSIRSTLQWVPVRSRVTAAKAAVLVPVLFAYGILTAMLGMAVSKIFAWDGASTSFSQGTIAALGMGAYFALLGVLCLGVAFALRSAAGTLVTVMVLLLPLPLLLASAISPAIATVFPSFAGMNAMVPPGEPNAVIGGLPPYGPWVAVLICACWAVAGAIGGTTILNRRDA
ncbi:ABC transporter integral membrane protein [Amycolatopsis jejuensis]|uniref:ABC transporter integral membrane protein n=1 Tax=Amycolatopsis jejuensis TaxID=330084 RepID=UPI00052667F6|nr:ABC transporter integral membrane protein [Amycolatopsis jejuensis]